MIILVVYMYYVVAKFGVLARFLHKCWRIAIVPCNWSQNKNLQSRVQRRLLRYIFNKDNEI